MPDQGRSRPSDEHHAAGAPYPARDHRRRARQPRWLQGDDHARHRQQLAAHDPQQQQSPGRLDRCVCLRSNFAANSVHSKPEADDFMLQLRQNYGHIGELFVASRDPHRVTVERACARSCAKSTPRPISSRPSATGARSSAVVIVAAEIGRELGLDTVQRRSSKWAVDYQIPAMRGVVREEYSDPLAIVADYLETINGNLIVTDKLNNRHQHPACAPQQRAARALRQDRPVALRPQDRLQGLLHSRRAPTR
jgi:hypothetical protein